MQRELTITIDEVVCDGLHRDIGRRRISRFLADLARPHVVRDDLEGAYAEMAADEAREREAQAWAQARIGEVADAGR